MTNTLQSILTSYVEEAMTQAGERLVTECEEYLQYEIRFGGTNISLVMLDQEALDNESSEPPMLIIINLFQGLNATFNYYETGALVGGVRTKDLRETTFNQTPEQTSETLVYLVNCLRNGRQF